MEHFIIDLKLHYSPANRCKRMKKKDRAHSRVLVSHIPSHLFINDCIFSCLEMPQFTKFIQFKMETNLKSGRQRNGYRAHDEGMNYKLEWTDGWSDGAVVTKISNENENAKHAKFQIRMKMKQNLLACTFLFLHSRHVNVNVYVYFRFETYIYSIKKLVAVTYFADVGTHLLSTHDMQINVRWVCH